MPAVVTYNPTSDPYINGVLGDIKWAGNTFTYSFPTSASFYGASYGEGETNDAFEALSTTQQGMTRAALKMYASVANLTFVEIGETASQHGDLRFAMSDLPKTAWAYFPSTRATGGDAWFNNSSRYYDNPLKGNYASLTFIHEIGHALGLEHAHEHFAMPQDRDSMEYTVMSYRSYLGASTTTGYTNETWGYAQSLMMYDIAALQHMYGANYATNSGGTTYSWSPTTGEMFIDGVGQGAAGANRILMTVWDGGGADTYDFSQYTTALKVDLRPGEWTTTSATQLAKLHYNGSKTAIGNIANALLYNNQTQSLIENAVGGSGDDSLTGNQTANSLKGGAGADRLDGGAGNDRLDGGAGSDTAVFSGQRSHYSVTYLADGSIQIADLRGGAPDGWDIALNTEWFQFLDATLSFDDVRLGTSNPPVVATPTVVSVPTAGEPSAVNLVGTTGNDTLNGEVGNDILSGLSGNDVLHGGAGSDHLNGGKGTDCISYAASTGSVLADLLSGKGSGGDASGDMYASVENITGSARDDALRGNNSANVIKGGDGTDTIMGRSGNDTLAGGLGDDKLHGQTGRDVLTGGGGRDTFLFKAVSESRGSLRDTIKDFVRGADHIDVRGIDANTKVSGNQAFTFIGKSAFTGKAGQLSFADGVLSGDVNGDAIADFQIVVSRLKTLTKGDFYL
jgi:serralysin